jgi:uncharacterized repeat protein (TIGR03803 family)
VKSKFSPKLLVALCWVTLLCLANRSAQAQTATTLYNFGNPTTTGQYPYAGLIVDSSGNLYGTTNQGGANGSGTVFELVNSSGTYSEKVLHSFSSSSSDGCYPRAGLIIDSSGNLYGTTPNCGTNFYGTVFELVNSGGTYTEQVLYSFAGPSAGDGVYPQAGLVMDSSGNLYGTTGAVSGGINSPGIAFELVNSGGTYSEKVLYTFSGSLDGAGVSNGGLILDSAGNLYGTTTSGGSNGNGSVFELVNSSGSYSENVLYSFTGTNGDGSRPYAGVTMDASGNLYGTTNNGGANSDGIVFELVNSSGSYSEKVLYSFAIGNGDTGFPQAGVILDSLGDIFGIGNDGNGAVFALINNSGSYKESVLTFFPNTCGATGSQPQGNLVMDASGNLYGTTLAGGTSIYYGTVFSLNHILGPAVATTTTITSSANPANSGDYLVLSAAVTASSGTTSGTVTFSQAGTVLGTQILNCGYTSISLQDAAVLGIGSYAVQAQYSPGVPALAASSATLNQTVTEKGVAVTSGNNTLDGNQTIDGSVSASSVSATSFTGSFTGNGSGLTGVLASGLNCAFCVGNSQLGINYAGSTSQGGPAANSLMLGGLLPSSFQPAGSYASTGANFFSGAQSITGNLSVTGNSATTGTTTIGSGGTPIVEHLSALFDPTLTLRHGVYGPFCLSETFTLSGVSDGDTVALGVPGTRMPSSNIMYMGWVSAANTVTIRACSFGQTASFGTGAIRVDVWRH